MEPARPVDAHYDVAVVGAGPAGMMAAIEAARTGAGVVLLEKNARPGLKILISGGGRCNLTTTKAGRELEREYGLERGRWLRHALRSFQPRDLVALVEAAGVPLEEQDLDKIFPRSNRARDVADAFVRMVADAGAELVGQAPLEQLERDAVGEAFRLHTPRGIVGATCVVLATGGLSYPKTGATGDGYAFARAFGHDLVPTVPHLAPLRVDEAWVRELAGIVLDSAEIAVTPRGGGKDLCRRRRPVLFTHKGLSGPGAMDLAGYIEERGGDCDVRLDLDPTTRPDELEASWLAAVRSSGRRHATGLLPATIPERLRQALVERAGAAGVPVAEVRKDARRRLLDSVKRLVVPVDRSLGFAHAEVTRGGVPRDEVDAATMESRRAPGLYLCGEIVDVDGPIGGFNFQAAFATGRLAGLHAAARARDGSGRKA